MAFRFDQLTLESQAAVQKAQGVAQERGHQRLEPMHLLTALLDPEQTVVRSLLGQLRVNPAQLLRALEEGLSALPKVTGGEATLSPELGRVLDQAQVDAERMKDQYVSVEHLLLALTKVKSRAQDVLEAVGVTEKGILQALQRVRGRQLVTDQNPEDEYQALGRYGRDLVYLARQGKMDPVIGRDREVRQMMSILCRRTRNNPFLLGQPGVGRRAIVEGLAQRIVTGDVPEALQDRKLFEVDMGAVISGTRSRQEIEQRIKGILDEAVRSEGRIILFVSDFSLLVGKVSAEWSYEVASLFKSALQWGGFRCIGIATQKDYNGFVDVDPVLRRLFEPIYTTTRQTARNAGDYEGAASGFLERTYADRSGASSGLSTTYGILFFVGFLAVCRTVEFISPNHLSKTPSPSYAGSRRGSRSTTESR